MIDISALPHVLAGINVATAALLVAGYRFIRNGDRARHRACMLSAVMLLAVFFAVYVLYHANAGFQAFRGLGAVRVLFFTLLASHVLGAMAIVVLVPVTALRALRGRFDKHRRLAVKTLPAWLFVTITGVIVHVMTYYIYPAPAVN